ncbi:MAG: glycosyltransferase [Longicatena sp.]
MKNYLFINNSLSGNGGAKVILNLANILISRGHSVSILLDRTDNIEYNINSKIIMYRRMVSGIDLFDTNNISESNKKTINYKHVGISSKLKNVIKKIIFLLNFPRLLNDVNNYRKFIKKNRFDVIVNNNIYIGIDRVFFEKKLSNNYYVNFHNSPLDVFKRADFFHVLPLEKIFYKANILSVSKGITEELSQSFKFCLNSERVIYNPFSIQELREASDDMSNIFDGEYIIMVSTLSKRKRVDRAIECFSQVCLQFPNLNFIILGKGELEHELKLLAEKLGVEDRVIFLGFSDNPYKYIARSKCLILTSDSEGLPTVIIEALILGVPVISTDCPTGPSEILDVFGDECLVSIQKSESKIIDEMSKKICSLLRHEYGKEYIINKAGLERFSSDRIAHEWEMLGYKI